MCKTSKSSSRQILWLHQTFRPLQARRQDMHQQVPRSMKYVSLCWILVLEAKLMGEEQIWKNYSYFCWVYLWQLYHTSEINDTCACMTSYFNKLLGTGLRTCKNRFFFSICFSIIPADPDISQPLEEKTIHKRLGRYGKSHFQLRYAWHSIEWLSQREAPFCLGSRWQYVANTNIR